MKKKQIRIPTRTSLACLVCLLTGQHIVAAELTLTSAMQQAFASSPQIKAQGELTSLAANDRWRRFLINEPQFTYTSGDDGSLHSYGLQLAVPFPGKSLAMVSGDSAKYRAQLAEQRARKYDLAKLVVQSYLDCASAQANVDLQHLTARDLQTVFNTMKALYESGHSTQAEKISSELQFRQAQLDMLTAEDKSDVVCKKFYATMAAQQSADEEKKPTPKELPRLVLPDDLDDAVVRELGDETSDQARAVAASDVALSTGSLAGWSQLPDLTLNVSRNDYTVMAASPIAKAWTTTFSVGVTIPIFYVFGERLEARRTRSQATLDRNAAELQKLSADSDQLDGQREYRRSKSRLSELRGKDLALAEALVDSTYSAYRAGKLGFAELVLSRKTLTDLRTQDIAMRASIVGARLRCLNHCAGGTL